MLKKRLIFVLYFDEGSFFLSRNFRLQRVGDVHWLVDKFRFKSIGRFIDEMVILDVRRDAGAQRCSSPAFISAVTDLMRETFVPLTIGGGLKTLEDARRCFGFGADKILLNSVLLHNPDYVAQCVSVFGAQAVVGGVDVVREGDTYKTKVDNAQAPGLPLEQHLELMASLSVGEVLLNSVERDGTGTGFDVGLLSFCAPLTVPVIFCGGAGKPQHFAQVLASPAIDAAATGNLFNFMGNGFELTRRHLVEAGYPVRRT